METPICYLPKGDTRTPCGKSPGRVQHTDDASQATCPECYRALTDGYAKTRLEALPAEVQVALKPFRLFDLSTRN